MSILGTNFVESKEENENLLCRFGNASHYNTTIGKFISSSEIECLSPPGENLMSNEVQSIELSGSDISSEIQILDVYSLPEADEVQAITSSAWGIQNEIHVIEVQIAVASADIEIQTIKTILRPSGEKQTIRIDTQTYVPEVQNITIVSQTNSLSGTFAITHGFYTTDEIPYDASANELASAISALNSLNTVDVSRELINGGYDGFTWIVTFSNDVGDISNLQVDTTNLIGLDVSDSVAEMITAIPCEVQAISTIGIEKGTFTLFFEGQETYDLEHDSSANEVKAALESLDGIGDVKVSLEDQNSYAGRTWRVTFLENGGDVSELTADDKSFNEGLE